MAARLAAGPNGTGATPTDPPRPDYSGQVELGLTSQSGNTDRLDAFLKARASRVTPRSTLALSAALGYGEAKGEKNSQENSGAVNYDCYPWRRWSVFGFATVLNNPFQDLNTRWSVAAGGRYMLLSGRRGSLALSLAALREDERFLDGSSRHRNRFSWRDKGELRLGARVTVTNVTFLVQSLDRPWDEYRVESTTELTAPAGEWISFRHSFRYQYDTTPRPGVERTDRKVASGIVLTLR